MIYWCHGGTPVVRTYIDQLAQVLSALVGWSKITKCENGGGCNGNKGRDVNAGPHGDSSCKYLQDVTPNTPCEQCKCIKWDVPPAGDHSKGHHLGKGCQRCSDSAHKCTCNSACGPGQECQCAKAGKCCKCCCKEKGCKCSEKECICGMEDRSYKSAYSRGIKATYVEVSIENRPPLWSDLSTAYRWDRDKLTPSQRRHQCARILLGSVCLIWSGITYMHWTGKWAKGSPRWNNHILNGSGLDDGTLSQWLQALGFPREMLNNGGPQNRLDKVIWDGFMGQLFLGFTHPKGSNAVDGNTAKQPTLMNYAGFVHTAHRDSFNEEARVFPNGNNSSTAGEISENDKHKIGAIFKLYILSCAYFTGLQKISTTHNTTSRTPKTIREILYWLSALPYSSAYKQLLEHGKESLKKVAPEKDGTKTLSFFQTGLKHPITVDEFNLFAHFQAVTQYCPLVLIGIQGGLHSPKGTDGTREPPIHALYSNTQCNFSYPTLDIQAYNQVVHYIRALFYQLYFLRKQCAVKVTYGGKWRECRYGSGVESKGVISWMCLGCDPMEHDRKSRVEKVNGKLDGVKNGTGEKDTLVKSLVDVLKDIGEVVVQLGNAQESLDRGKADLDGVMKALKDVFSEGNGNNFKDVLQKVLEKLEKDKVKGLETVDGLNGLKEAANQAKEALEAAKKVVDKQHGKDVDPCKNLVSAAIHGLQKALEAFMKWAEQDEKDVIEQAKKTLEYVGTLTHAGDEINLRNVKLEAHYSAILKSIRELLSICNNAKCTACNSHSNKCGKKPVPTTCEKCHQQYMDGTPSPLQAFLEDRLPGFSCQEVPTDDTPEYPSAASHLGHCNGSGQCCPLPMGFRNNFQDGVTNTGQRLYGILYFFSNENMMQSCVYTLVRVTAELSATTPQVLGDVFGFFRGGVGNNEEGEDKSKGKCDHSKDPKDSNNKDKYFCGWCASGLRDEVKNIGWIPTKDHDGGQYRSTVGQALIEIKGDKGAATVPFSSTTTTNTTTNLSTLTDGNHYLSPLTGELYTAVSATFGGTYLSWVLYLSDALEGGLKSLSEAFQQIECRGCRECDPNKCKKGHHGDQGSAQCQCQSIVSCTGVLPVLYRHGFSYGNPFNLEGYQQKDGNKEGDYSIEKAESTRKCHQFLDSLQNVIKTKEEEVSSKDHPLSNLLSQVGKLQYDIRLPWIFVLAVAWLVAVLYLAFGAIWPLDWTHMRSHWLRGGEHQWQCMWYKVMTGRKGVDLMEYFGRR